ncbi:hypothetical protein N9I21_01570 [Crocinitomicaceae bacterium]|nr:hypothetical protein [Crocinitomicaceae bacterium]
MKTTLLFTFLIITGISFGQGFNRGYDVGWQTGYCYDASYGCMAPTTPFAPFPSMYESSTSYSDGYHRGLTDGMNKGRADRRAKINSQINTRQSYSTPQIVPKYEPFVPDYEFYEKAMQKTQSRLQKARSNADNSTESSIEELEKGVGVWLNQRKSEETQRIELMKTIRSQISSFEYYPSSIPDGSYWPYYINDTEYSLPECISIKYAGKREKASDCDKRMVLVANNKIIFSNYKLANLDILEFDPNFFGSNPFNIANTLSSLSIFKGVARTTKGKTDKYGDPCGNKFDYITSLDEKYYFLQYLTNYNDAQILLKKIQEKYKLISTHSRISDGWHVAYLTDRKAFCDIRNVYVKNNKVVKWIGGQGDELIPDTGGEINNSKSTFSRKFPSDNEAFEVDEQWVQFTKYTWMNRPKTEIYDVYFINL